MTALPESPFFFRMPLPLLRVALFPRLERDALARPMERELGGGMPSFIYPGIDCGIEP